MTFVGRGKGETTTSYDQELNYFQKKNLNDFQRATGLDQGWLKCGRRGCYLVYPYKKQKLKNTSFYLGGHPTRQVTMSNNIPSN